MKSRTLKQYFKASVLVAICILSSTFVSAQRKRVPTNNEELPINNACPRPVVVTLNATTPNVVNSDFSALQLSAPRAWLNDPATNKNFLYTFQWQREERCCEITKAVLTVRMKANQGGQSKTSSDAGNDGISVMYLGSTVPPFSQSIYGTWPFAAGQITVKTWTLTGAALNNLNLTRRLSIYVQDDTSVLSATLRLSGCCLGSANAAEPVGYTTQAECEDHEKAPCSVQYGGWHRTN